MRVVIAGGSGLLGRALAVELAPRYTVRVLTRRPRAGHPEDVAWDPRGGADGSALVDGAHAVVNLTGAGIADRRWTAARKAELRDSRLDATRALVSAITAAAQPPRLFVSGSAVGYYGARDDTPLPEEAPAGGDFLAQLCVDWERAAQAAAARTGVAIVRTGVVLTAAGGALPKMLPPFKLGVGGPTGSGRQYFPWIHLRDWVRLVAWLIDREADGVFNATAPEGVTNAEFARALGRALHRPAVLPVPAFALRLALGELADALLHGQRPVPAHARALGFQFQFPTIDAALRDIVGRPA